MKSLNEELARLMGFFSTAAGPVSALSGEQAGGPFSPTAVIAQPPSPRSGGGGFYPCSLCGADCTCMEGV